VHGGEDYVRLPPMEAHPTLTLKIPTASKIPRTLTLKIGCCRQTSKLKKVKSATNEKVLGGKWKSLTGCFLKKKDNSDGNSFATVMGT